MSMRPSRATWITLEKSIADGSDRKVLLTPAEFRC
jgi:hypothetical protein